MVQIFMYCKHVKILRELKHTKLLAGDCNITRFFLAGQLFVYYGAPHVHVNLVATYRHVDGKRSMHHESKGSNEPNVCARGCGFKDLENSKIRISIVYSNKKLKLNVDMHQRNFPL